MEREDFELVDEDFQSGVFEGLSGWLYHKTDIYPSLAWVAPTTQCVRRVSKIETDAVPIRRAARRTPWRHWLRGSRSSSDAYYSIEEMSFVVGRSLGTRVGQDVAPMCNSSPGRSRVYLPGNLSVAVPVVSSDPLRVHYEAFATWYFDGAAQSDLVSG